MSVNALGSSVASGVPSRPHADSVLLETAQSTSNKKVGLLSKCLNKIGFSESQQSAIKGAAKLIADCSKKVFDVAMRVAPLVCMLGATACMLAAVVCPLALIGVPLFLLGAAGASKYTDEKDRKKLAGNELSQTELKHAVHYEQQLPLLTAKRDETLAKLASAKAQLEEAEGQLEDVHKAMGRLPSRQSDPDDPFGDEIGDDVPEIILENDRSRPEGGLEAVPNEQRDPNPAIAARQGTIESLKASVEQLKEELEQDNNNINNLEKSLGKVIKDIENAEDGSDKKALIAHKYQLLRNELTSDLAKIGQLDDPENNKKYQYIQDQLKGIDKLERQLAKQI